jgi:hypothetical protein
MQREGEAPPLPSVLCNNTPLAPSTFPAFLSTGNCPFGKFPKCALLTSFRRDGFEVGAKFQRN